MIGSVAITVKDQRNSYSFELKRNITILCGESGRGKTTLFEMVSDYNRFGKSSGVKVSCSRELVAIDGSNWQNEIAIRHNSVIIIDEDNKFIRSKEFASIAKNSSNYYLIITRAELSQLPISVDEIYEIAGNKNKRFKRVYTHIDRMFNRPNEKLLPFKPDVIITEDSNSGFQFFERVSRRAGIQCLAACGKSNIYAMLENYRSSNVLIVADGAAFGSEIRNIAKRQELYPRKIAICLPESFEWVLLKSGIISSFELSQLENPENNIDSSKYFSWEQYFTEVLVDSTQEIQYQRYPKNKGRLPEYYMQEDIARQILTVLPGVNLE